MEIIPAPTSAPAAVCDRHHALAEQADRQHRLGRAPLDHEEQQQRETEKGQPDRRSAAAVHADQERGEAQGEQTRPGPVQRVPVVLDVLVQRDHQETGRRDARRDVDEEDPAPGEVLDDDAAEQRPDQPGHAPDGPEHALHARALFQVVDVADDGERGGLHRAGAEALQRPEGDQRADSLGEPAGHRADEKQRDPAQQHRLAAVQVGELAVERDGDRGGQQVRGEDPRVVVDSAQVSDHGRHGRGDHGHFHRRHREAEQERDDGQGPVGLHRERRWRQLAGRRNCALRLAIEDVHRDGHIGVAVRSSNWMRESAACVLAGCIRADVSVVNRTSGS